VLKVFKDLQELPEQLDLKDLKGLQVALGLKVSRDLQELQALQALLVSMHTAQHLFSLNHPLEPQLQFRCLLGNGCRLDSKYLFLLQDTIQ
jgi:hypothetical protein